MDIQNDSSIIEIIKLAGGPLSVIALGWWIRGKFSEIEDMARESLTDHEKQDERRHRQNLVRFARINMKLGINDQEASNGNYDGHHSKD